MIRLHIDGDTFDFDEGTLMLSEAIEWQRLSGKVPADVLRGWKAGEPDCLKLVVYLLMRREGREVKFSELDFNMATAALEIVDGDTDGEGEQGSDPTPAKKPTTKRTPSKRKPIATSSGSRAT